MEKIRARLGKPEAVEVIHGGVPREERRKVVERFMQDRDMRAGANGFSEGPISRREIELAAMAAVIDAETALGNTPSDVSAQKVGYDIASCDPKADHLRFIEVKGRIDGADTVTVTRQEVMTSLHEPDRFILAIVQVGDGYVQEPRYVRKPFTQEPGFGITAIQVNIKNLLERAKEPS